MAASLMQEEWDKREAKNRCTILLDAAEFNSRVHGKTELRFLTGDLDFIAVSGNGARGVRRLHSPDRAHALHLDPNVKIIQGKIEVSFPTRTLSASQDLRLEIENFPVKAASILGLRTKPKPPLEEKCSQT